MKKKSKAGRLFSLLLVACMLTGMFPSAAFAAGSDIVTYPVTGGNIYFDKSTGTITDCDQSVTEVVIPEEIEGVAVTEIGGSAFSGCSSLSSIEIPEGVTEIGGYAFYECSSLSSIEIPEGVTEIRDSIFYGCSSLKTAGPTGSGCNYEFGWTEKIPNNAFSGCSSLSSIEIPEGVTEIGSRAFSGCSSLSSIEIPEGVTEIGEDAFDGCSSLSSIEIPEGVTKIGSSTFSGCRSLSSIEIPEGVTEIGSHAFSGCSSLSSIEIPEEVTEIGWYAFQGCSSLSSIEIPEGVTEIGGSIFYGCSSLKTAGPTGSGCNYEFGWTEKIPNYAFHECSSLSSIEIPEGVTEIGGYAFSECSSLSSIEIPEGVTKIGDYAFNRCSSLSSIEIPEGVTEIGSRTFSGCSSLSGIEIPEGVTKIGSSTFSGCSSLSNIEIPEGVTEIGEDAFDGCSSLSSIEIPEGVTEIGSSAFSGCSSLSSIEIPEGVTEIGSRTFSGCSSLSSIEIPEGVTEIGSSAFSGCSSLSSIEIPEGVTGIWSGTFSGCSSLSSIEIPEGVTEIGEYAFSGCSSLSSIEIPEGVTEIGEYTFSGCSSLGSIEIPEGVTEIERYAFYNCENLNHIIIPGSVLRIGKYTTNMYGWPVYYSPFNKRNSLETAGPIGSGCNYEFGWTEKIPDHAFHECSSLSSIEIPEGVTEIGSYAFSGCSSLSRIEIPEGVTEIGDCAFNGCSSLSNIEIPEGVTEIGDCAFDGCSSLSDIYYRGSEEQWSAISIGTDNDPLTEATIHFNSEMPGETSSEQGLHIYTDVPSRIVTVEDTFSVGAVMIDEDGNDTDLSGITFIVEDDNILRAQDVYEKDGVLYCSFRANSAGTTRIRVRDANADRAATISFTVEPVTGDAYTVNNFQDTYKNGIQIKNSRVSENSDGSYDISFDAYNRLYLYGAVEVYDADGQLQDAEYLDKWTDVAGIKDVVSYICEIALVSVGQTYWKELASAETHIDVRVPKGGYILISANPKESVVCSMLNSMDLIWQYMDYMGKLKGSLSSEKQLPKVIIQKIQEESDSFLQKWTKAFFNEAFQKSITSEAGIQDFIKGLVNVLMSNDLDQMVAGTLAETLEGSATDLFTDWFTTASGPAGIAINGIFSVSGASNTVIQTIQFCKYSEARFITVQVPDGDKRVNSDITVDCDMNDDTALSVYKIDVEESKKYLVSIADIENQNVKPGNPEDGPGYQRPVDPSSVDIWAAYDIRLVDGEDEYVPENGAEVILPLPEELRGYIGKVKVYRIDENGDTTVLWGVSDGTRVSVVTDHFSVYIIASTSVDQNSIKGEYNIDSLQILDSDGQVLNSIPSGEFYVDADLSKSDGAGDAVLVLAAYDPDGKILSIRCAKTSSAEEGGTVNIRMENPDGEVAEVRAFVLRSLGMPVSLCPAVSVGNSSAMS